MLETNIQNLVALLAVLLRSLEAPDQKVRQFAKSSYEGTSCTYGIKGIGAADF